MSPVRTAGLVTALLVVLAIVGAPATSAGGRTKPPPVYIGAHGEYVRAAQGSYCWTYKSGGRGTGACADAAYPLHLSARLTVAGRQRLTVDVGRRAKRLGASLVRVEGEKVIYGHAVRAKATGRGRFWKLRLPADLEDVDALSLDLVYRQGDSNVWAGLEVGGSP